MELVDVNEIIDMPEPGQAPPHVFPTKRPCTIASEVVADGVDDLVDSLVQNMQKMGHNVSQSQLDAMKTAMLDVRFDGSRRQQDSAGPQHSALTQAFVRDMQKDSVRPEEQHGMPAAGPQGLLRGAYISHMTINIGK